MADPTISDVFLAIKKIREETPDLAWMLDYPEVAKLLIRRASGEIDDQKFRYELYRTRFWRTTDDAQRQWRTLTSIDPAKATRQRQEMAARVRQLMGELGVQLPRKRSIGQERNPRAYDAQGRTSAARVADMALYNGWSEAQVTNYLLSMASWGQEGQSPTGGIAAGMTQMRRLAEEYGVDPRDKRLFQWTKRVLAGTDTIEGVEERLRAQATARYGSNETLAGVLDRGGTLADWFADYRRLISSELEIPEEQISMNGRRWREVLMHEGGDGKVRPMTGDEVLKWTRSQREWATTRGGKEKEAALVNNMLSVFGQRAA